MVLNMSCLSQLLIIKYCYDLTGNYNEFSCKSCKYLTFFLHRSILSKTGVKTPRVELKEVGPSVDFIVRRDQMASADLFKTACKRPNTKVFPFNILNTIYILNINCYYRVKKLKVYVVTILDLN